MVIASSIKTRNSDRGIKILLDDTRCSDHDLAGGELGVGFFLFERIV